MRYRGIELDVFANKLPESKQIKACATDTHIVLPVYSQAKETKEYKASPQASF